MRYEVTANSTVAWNVLGGGLSVSIPAGKLKSNSVTGWPANGIDFPGLTIDSSGNFERRINLPIFDFDGITLQSGGNVNDNHVRFKRLAGVVSVAVRDTRDFFGSDGGKFSHLVCDGPELEDCESGSFNISSP